MKPSRLRHSCTSIYFLGRCIVSTLGACCKDSSKHYKEILVIFPRSQAEVRQCTLASDCTHWGVGIDKQKQNFLQGLGYICRERQCRTGNRTTIFAALSEVWDVLVPESDNKITYEYFSRSVSPCPFGLSHSLQVSTWLKLGPKSHVSSKKAYYGCHFHWEKSIDIVVALLYYCLKTRRRHLLFLFMSRHGRT
jgi:hypothetical protein